MVLGQVSQQNSSETMIMIVYGVEYGSNNPFPEPYIYGAFADFAVGFKTMKELQDSKEYGYLNWNNRIIKIE